MKAMNLLKDEPPSFFQDEVAWDEETVQGFSSAINTLRQFDERKVPLQKLQALVTCYQDFAAVIPKSVAV